MFTANVGFLAIQAVIVVPQNGWTTASPTQIASSISLVYSLGSTIIGQLLIRRNRTMAMQDTKTAVRARFPFDTFRADWLPVEPPE